MIKFNPLSPIGFAACLAGACLAGGTAAKLANGFPTPTPDFHDFQTFPTTPPTPAPKGARG